MPKIDRATMKDMILLLEGCKTTLEEIISSEYVNWDALREYSSAEIYIDEIDNLIKELK